jgi:hypothetical protein
VPGQGAKLQIEVPTQPNAPMTQALPRLRPEQVEERRP